MNIREIMVEYPEEFQEAVDDLDWRKISELVNTRNGKLSEYIYDHFNNLDLPFSKEDRDNQHKQDEGYLKRKDKMESHSFFDEAAKITNMGRDKYEDG